MLEYCNDLHLHTNLSACAPRDVFAHTYIPFCKDEGVKVVGFSNHIYSKERMENEHPDFKGTPGMYPLILKDDIERIKENNKNIKVLLGCEAETIYGQDVSVSYEESKHYDYVLLAASHIYNLRGAYDYLGLDNPDKLRDFMIERFKYACGVNLAVPCAICHPFYPILAPFEQEAVDSITELEFEECFKLANENNKAIEVHACLFRNGTCLNDDGVSPSYLRMLSVAKECGCKFYIGSDAHFLSGFTGIHQKLMSVCDYLGITDYDIWDIARY